MLSIKNLKEEIYSKYERGYLYILRTIFYDIEKALENRNDEDILIISQWIDESIEDYFTYELNEAISTAKELVLGGRYNYEKFFEPTNGESCSNEWKPIIDEIIYELDVSTYDNTSDNEALQRVLNYTFSDSIYPLEDVKDYEIMAVMALKHIQSALKNSDRKLQKEQAISDGLDEFDLVDDWLYASKEQAIKDSLYACLAAKECRTLYDSEKHFERLLEVKKNILKERARKGGIEKNKKMTKIKEEILQRYQDELIRYKNFDKVISKNDFARRMAEEYNLKYGTIRNNWLKGYNPKI